MIRSAKIDEPTQKQIVHLFEDILLTLPANCASLDVKESPTDKDVYDVALVPANEKSAEFGVILMRAGLYAVFFGRGKLFTTYECPWEIRLGRWDGLAKHIGVIEKNVPCRDRRPLRAPL